MSEDVARYVTVRTPPPLAPELAEALGGEQPNQVWQILIPNEHHDAVVAALVAGRVLSATVMWTAPNPYAVVWGFTFEAVIAAAEAIDQAGIPMVKP